MENCITEIFHPWVGLGGPESLSGSVLCWCQQHPEIQWCLPLRSGLQNKVFEQLVSFRMLARSGWVVQKSCRVFHKWEKTLLYLFAQHMQQSSQESEQGNPQKARQQDKGTRQGNRAGQGKEADWGTSKSQWSNNCREWTLAKSIWKPSHKIWTVANINLQTTAEKQNPIVHATQFANKCKGPNTRPPKGVNVSQEPEDCIDSMGYIWTCSFWCVCMLHLNRRNAY